MEFSMLPWETQSGTGDGAAPYTQLQSNNFFRNFDVRDPASEGIAWGVTGNLEVTGSVSPLTVAPGAAICYGRYWSDANVQLTVSTPSAGATGGLVVLRTDWATNTTRAALKMSSDGVATIPSVVQTVNTTWELPLASFVIDTSGNVWKDASLATPGVKDARLFAASPLGAGTVIYDRQLAVNAAVSSLNFDDIPQTFTHLRVYMNVSLTAALASLEIQFNNKTTTAYYASHKLDFASSLIPYISDPADSIEIGLVGGAMFSSFVFDVMFYTSSNFKGVHSRGFSYGIGLDPLVSVITHGVFRSADVITSMQFAGGTLIAGSQARVVGLR